MGADPGAEGARRRRRSGSPSAAASSSGRGPSTRTSRAASSPPPPTTASTSSGSTTRSTTSRTCARPPRRSSPPSATSRPGSSTAPARTGEIDTLIERARLLPGARRRARAPARSDRLAAAAPGGGARRRPRRGERPADRDLRPGRRRQRARRDARGRARRRAADRVRHLSARAVAPPRLRRGAVGGARRDGARPRHRRRRALARPATSSTSTSATSRWRRSRRGSPSAPRSTTSPRASSPGVDSTLRAQDAGDRLEEVLEELDQIRAEIGWPPLAAPIGQVLASQALLNVLSASRYLTVVDELRALLSGHFGTPPGPIDAGGAARRRADAPTRRPRRTSPRR